MTITTHSLQAAFDRGIQQVRNTVLSERNRLKAQENSVDFFEQTIGILSALSGDLFERMGEVYKRNDQGDHFFIDGDECKFLLASFNHDNFVDMPLFSRRNSIHDGHDRKTQWLNSKLFEHEKGIWERNDLKQRVIDKLRELDIKVSQAGFKVMVEQGTHNNTHWESCSEISSFPRKIWLVKKEPLES